MSEGDDLTGAMEATLRLSGVPGDDARELAPAWLEAVRLNGIPGTDALNGIEEYNPALVDALAFGLGLGRSVAIQTGAARLELREMAEAGLLVSSMVERALRKAGPDLIEMARSLPRQRALDGRDYAKLLLSYMDDWGVPGRQRGMAPDRDRVIGGPDMGGADWYPFSQGSTPHHGDLPPAEGDPDGIGRGLRDAPDAMMGGHSWYQPEGVLRPESGYWVEVTTLTDTARIYVNVSTGARWTFPFADRDPRRTIIEE